MTRQRDEMLYFAYGSNMDSGRIKAADRCPGAKFVCIAKLSAHRLAFTRKSKDGHGVADAVPTKRCVVWGVVWRLTPEDVVRLDKREGAKAAEPKYVRLRVSVHRADGKELACETYFVAEDQREKQEVSTTKQYVGHLFDGAREHKLPRYYLAKLRSLWQAARGDERQAEQSAAPDRGGG